MPVRLGGLLASLPARAAERLPGELPGRDGALRLLRELADLAASAA